MIGLQPGNFIRRLRGRAWCSRCLQRKTRSLRDGSGFILGGAHQEVTVSRCAWDRSGALDVCKPTVVRASAMSVDRGRGASRSSGSRWGHAGRRLQPTRKGRESRRGAGAGAGGFLLLVVVPSAPLALPNPHPAATRLHVAPWRRFSFFQDSRRPSKAA